MHQGESEISQLPPMLPTHNILLEKVVYIYKRGSGGGGGGWGVVGVC